MAYDKLKLLDKVVHEFVNYDKPYEYAKCDLPIRGSGMAPMPLPNDKIEGLICKIETIRSKCYNFNQYDEYGDNQDIGEYETEETFYYILGSDKKFQDYQLKKI